MSTNYHTVIATGAAANASVFNAPLGTLDTAITANATSITGLTSTITTVLNSVILGGAAVTLTNGAANAAQKVVTVDSSAQFVAGCYVEYTLVGGVVERNVVDTVDSSTQITLVTNIGTGGIADNTPVAVIPIGFYNSQAGEFNVLNYGASPSASAAVNVAAIQAAIDAADGPGATVKIPAGVYSIDSTISMVNRSGVRLVGQGSSSQYTAGSKLLWTGSAGDIMLDMSGTNYCSVEGIGFYANASDPGAAETDCTAIYCAGNPTFNGSFFNHIERCWFQNFDIAVELGVAADQVDTWTFDKCWWYKGPDGTALKVNSYNCLNIALTHCTITALAAPGAGDTGKAVHLVDGNVKMVDCTTAGNKFVVYSEDVSGNLSLIGHHSEEDGTLIYTTAVGNHQKANLVSVTELFVYAPVDQLFYFGNANWQYVVNGAFITGATTIYVPDDPQEVFLNQVTGSGTLTIKNISDAAVNVYGWYGTQGTSVRTGRLPAIADLVIGSGGTAITKHLSDSAAWNPGELINGASEATDFTVVGAAVGDVVTVGMRLTVGGTDETGAWQISGRVRTTNIVTVTLTNHTGETKNLESQTCRVDVWKH